jgi:hypothetical protein
MIEVLVVVCVVALLLLVFVLGILVGGVGVLLLVDKGEPVMAPVGEEPPIQVVEAPEGVFDFP